MSPKISSLTKIECGNFFSSPNSISKLKKTNLIYQMYRLPRELGKGVFTPLGLWNPLFYP